MAHASIFHFIYYLYMTFSSHEILRLKLFPVRRFSGRPQYEISAQLLDGYVIAHYFTFMPFTCAAYIYYYTIRSLKELLLSDSLSLLAAWHAQAKRISITSLSAFNTHGLICFC